jgi:hypothetical protein
MIVWFTDKGQFLRVCIDFVNDVNLYFIAEEGDDL